MTARRRGKIRSEKQRDPSGASRPQDDKGSRPQDDRRLDAVSQERSSQLLLFFAMLIVLHHVWGMLQPSHDNWGVHFFGFYSSEISLCALCIVLLLLIPKTQTWLLGFVENGVRFLARLPLVANIVIVGGIILACAVEFPAKLHLLGDGAVLLRSINQSQWGADLVASFRNQPLMIWIFRSLMGIYATGGSVKPYDVYEGIDLISCALFVILVFWFLRSLDRPLLERVLLGCFILGCAGSQFFFGYVENYVLQYVFTALFVVTGWFSAERKMSVIVPICCYAVMVGLHLGNLIFFPGILILVYLKLGGNRIRAILATAGLSAVIVASMFAMGFNLNDFLRHITSGSVDFLQPFSAVGGNFAYPMFSLSHFWDWLNGSLLIVPFGLAVALAFLTFHSKELQWRDPAFLFLLATAACGLLFTWIINSALGMARDWDLLTSFFTPLMILDVYLLSRPIGLKSRRYLLAIIAGVTLLHTGAWIGVNASADRHLRRMELLNNPRYLSPTTQLVFDEALANYFFDTQNYKDARTYYELYLTIDDHNPRILANIADVYRRVGERQKYFDALLHAVAANSRDPGVYLNLGVEYANRHDTAAAVKYNEQAVAMDSTQKLAHANLGILYTNLRNYKLADRHFSSAIYFGLREPAIYRYAGDVCYVLDQYDRALRYYDSYLELVPADQKVRDARDRIRRALADSPKQQ
ncbi:MAG TPA: tetratricopeptide repeat protein [Bacteroidota bacterium]